MDSLCPESFSCWAGRSLPETVANGFPLLAGVSGGVKACIAVLVRYASSVHGMANFELSYLLFLGRFFAGGVGGANRSVCFLSRCESMKLSGACH